MTIPYICYASSQGSNDYRGCLGPVYYNLFDQRLRAIETIFPAETSSGKAVQDSFSSQKNKIIRALGESDADLIISGDHSSAMGTWQYMSERHPDMHLIWIDAHLDAHNPTDSQSHNIHGMPTAYLLGDFALKNDPSPLKVPLTGSQIHFIGTRSFEPIEQVKLEKYGASIYSHHDILASSLKEVIKKVLAKIGNQPYGISLDLDIFDPQYCPGVNCPADSGLLPEQLLKELPCLLKKCQLLEITEYNPAQDIDHQTRKIMSHIIDDYLEARMSEERT